MSEYERLLAEITSNPESDSARRAFAEYIRRSEPDRARFIELQLGEAHARRLERGYPDTDKPPLLLKNESRWAHTMAKYARSWTYDRGFIAEIAIDPHLFLEYGEWLSINEPIRAVEFLDPRPDPFPVAELAESPLLSRLDSIVLPSGLTLQELERLVSSPHLGRLMRLSSGTLIDEASYEIFAAAPFTKRALTVRFFGETFPGQRLRPTERDDYWGAPRLGWSELTPKGRELEQKYGYIPWLHPNDNGCYHLDAAWFVSQGILPVKQPGSAVDEK